MATKRSKLHTPEGTACYVNLFTPRQRTDAKGQPKGDPKYQLTLVFDKRTDLSELEAEAERVGKEKFGANFMNLVNKGKANWPFSSNDDKAEDDETGDPVEPFASNKGGVHVGFKSSDKPGIVDEGAEPIMDKSDVYSGMKARVSCRAFAYDNESKGVAFFLINVQKLGDGERLSGNPSAEDDFAPVKGKAKPTTTAPRRGKPADDDVDGLL